MGLSLMKIKETVHNQVSNPMHFSSASSFRLFSIPTLLATTAACLGFPFFSQAIAFLPPTSTLNTLDPFPVVAST